MFNHFTFRWLRWRRPNPDTPPAPLPDGIERFFVDTPGGKLEVLYAAPRAAIPPTPTISPPSPPPTTTTSSSPPPPHPPTSPSSQAQSSPSPPPPPPLFFIHGGMGGAFVWLDYLAFFAARGIPCYAVSLRGHGASYHPSFARMVYATTKRMLADDVVAAVRWMRGHQRGLRGQEQREREREREQGQQREGAVDVDGRRDGAAREGEEGKEVEVVLVGHSGGGGLAQMVLSEREVRARGLVLLASVSGFGAERVHKSWMSLDPWFYPRMLLHLGHPNSPLSHPALTKRAFFSEEQPYANVEAFQDKASPYESMVSGMEMIKPFINAQNVLGQITSYRSPGRQGILVLCGEVDKIMKLPMMEDLADTYRASYSTMIREKKLDGNDPGVEPALREGGRDNSGHGVRFNVVAGAGHYLQLDVAWIVGAQKLHAFYEQL